ncbi:MAG: hypothetical protein HYX24_07585 [Candidatus Aenigmarchaeota archaeon]|nr:hypothetical protein [Candidatus Aenigmarchaeota archaeon]
MVYPSFAGWAFLWKKSLYYIPQIRGNIREIRKGFGLNLSHELFPTIIVKKFNQKPFWIKPFDMLGSKRFSSMVYFPLITDVDICNAFSWITYPSFGKEG